jgi:hypothetical protein
VAVTAAAALLWLVQLRGPDLGTEAPPDRTVAARALLEDVDHPAVVAWGYGEPATRPQPTAHSGVQRLSPGAD